MIIEDKELLKKYVQAAQNRGKKVIIKTGCFDILHPGHIDVIRRLQKFADMVIIGVHCDEQVKKKKGDKRPINPQEQRALMVDGLKGVNFVFPMQTISRKGYIEFLKYLQPDFVAVTKTDKQKQEEYSSGGWKLIEIPDKKLPGYSTTEIINRILEAYGK